MNPAQRIAEGSVKDEARSRTPPEISGEEASMVWRALQELPEHFREPLVLFYREDQSIAAVAAAMDLSEDAVRQRLSRGRTMLREQVAALVEGVLARSRPGTAFRLGVLALLPAGTCSSEAALPGAATAKGSAALKGGWSAAMTSLMIGPSAVCSG